jgi:hypothetical protein
MAVQRVRRLRLIDFLLCYSLLLRSCIFYVLSVPSVLVAIPYDHDGLSFYHLCQTKMFRRPPSIQRAGRTSDNDLTWPRLPAFPFIPRFIDLDG